MFFACQRGGAVPDWQSGLTRMISARKLGGYLSPARERARADDDGHRPPGALVWFQATTPAHADVALQLAERLPQARPGTHLLMTAEAGMLPEPGPAEDVICRPLPNDTATAAQEFLDRWAPDICVWTAGDLRPTLLGAAHRRGVPLVLADADEARLTRSGWRLLPDATRAALRRFEVILARSPGTESFLRRRQGLRDARISVTGALHEQSRPLPCDEGDREELASLLRGRPVWLAAHLHRDEIDTVLRANSAITRMSHRALLVIVPEDGSDPAAFRAALKDAGLRHVVWSEGDLPDEGTQVILADTPAELGLWYRVAPISFMGGSLIAGMHGSDPNEPAAHGSAILYGPNIRSHLATYSRFAEAGAARIVRDADTLAAAVQQLIPPDQSAAMAHVAWDVATRSAAVMDDLVDLICDMLDRRKAG